MTTITDPLDLMLQTDSSGAPVRLEYVRGHTKWEASPAVRHQKAAKVIEASIRPIAGRSDGCACYSLQDVFIRFPDADSSIKRPDIAIFCAEPPDTDSALDMLPAAVIEILSLGYEEKDLGPDGAAFYLACGVLDVLIVDPRGRSAAHYRPGYERIDLATPATVALACGCRVALP